MKNFTNNFKQFTSRLSARWLIMALMLLLGTSSAWGVDYYLRGTFNDWLNGGMQDAYKFSGGTGTVKVNLTAGTYSFKIATNNWSEAYSVSNSTMKRGNSSNWQLYTNNGDLNIEADVTGEYSFKFNSSKQLTITYPPQCTTATSITSATLQKNGTISLAGNFTTCGVKYHGFQWRKVGSNWCGETDYANNKESNYVVLGNYDVNGSETGSFTPADRGTYEFRTYIATTSPWLYSTTTIEVSTCTAATLSWENTFTGNMKVGDEVSNPASLSDAAAGSITYESSDPSVIEVDGNTLRVLKSGTATITASATPNTGFCSIESTEKEVTVTCDIVNNEDIRIEVVCTSGDNPYIWAWEPDNNNNNLTDGEWPGKAMKSEGNNVYSWEAKPTSDQSVSIIISKNKDGANQTNDIDDLQIGKRYKFSYDPNTTVSGNNNRYEYQLLEEDCLPPACVAPADPTISITPEGLCGEGTVTITVEDSHIAEMYQLYIVNNGYTKRGNAQEGKIFTETPSKTTTYVVKALNGKCASNYSNPVTLTVYTQPTITQTKNTICKGEVISLNDCVSKVPDNATLTWYSDDAHSAQLSGDALNVSPATETTYYYQASINGACTVDGSITLTVNELPTNVDFGPNNTASVCQNDAVNLTTLSAWTKDGQTIQWYSKDGDIYTPIDANQTITADCTFYAKAIFSNTGCESEGYTSFNITTLESPDAPTLEPFTVCPQVGFDLTEKSGWTAPDDGSLNISWYEKSDEEYVAVNSAKLLNQGITQATTYYARVQNKETGCYSTYVSMSVSVATVSKLTITPATGTTYPWVPISYTVGTNETFEMSYPDGLTSLPNIEITQSNNGKTYTYNIPRPTDWGTGNKTPAREPKTYTIQAMLTGSSAECPSIGTATVTLNDEANDKCTK